MQTSLKKINKIKLNTKLIKIESNFNVKIN